MKITVEFESAEEFEAFKVSGKKTRTKKDETDEAGGSAPAPLAPPAGGSAQGFNPGGMSTAQFAPPAGGAVQVPGVFSAPAVAPEIAALVQRIVTKLDSAIASGQPADQALAWFKSQCGPETANYTLDQIKQQALPKLAQPVLENMAKLMAA